MLTASPCVWVRAEFGTAAKVWHRKCSAAEIGDRSELTFERFAHNAPPNSRLLWAAFLVLMNLRI